MVNKDEQMLPVPIFIVEPLTSVTYAAENII